MIEVKSMKQVFVTWLGLITLSGCIRPGGNPGAAPSLDSAPRVASGEIGNGGSGVKIGNRIFLVDLLEAGLESAPHYLAPPAQHLKVYLSARLAKRLPLHRSVIEKLAHKIHDVHSIDPVLGWALLETIRMYQWRLVRHDLRRLPLPGAILSFAEGIETLIANRRGRTIHLSEPALALMDDDNQVATVVHEAFYALIRPEPLISASKDQYVQSGARVREIVGYFFSADTLAKMRREGSWALIDGDELPLGQRLATAGKDSPLFPEVTASTTLEMFRPTGEGAAGRRRFILPNYQTTLATKTTSGYEDVTDADDVLAVRELVSRACKETGYLAMSIVPSSDAGGVELSFASYRERAETKTYVAFSHVPKPLGAQAMLRVFSGNGVEYCRQRFYRRFHLASLMGSPFRALPPDWVGVEALQSLQSIE